MILLKKYPKIIFSFCYQVKGRIVNAVGTTRLVAWWFKNLTGGVLLRLLWEHLTTLICATKNRKYYMIIRKQNLLALRKSSRAFIFGSGFSLNHLSENEWKKIKNFDCIGFNGAFHLHKVPFKYFLLKAGYETVQGVLDWRPYAEYALKMISSNPQLNKTTFLFPLGFTSSFTNRLIAYRMWDSGRPIFQYFTDRISRFPNLNLDEGLVQRMGTLCTTISFAVTMGYKQIVLIGVDLYDNRYFWVPANKTVAWSSEEKKETPSDSTVRGLLTSEPHNTVNNGVIRAVAEWQSYLKKKFDIKISVYNPKSLLVPHVPVFDWD